MLVPNIEYKSVLDECKSTDERNIRFLQLDEQSQRKEIAWDALNLLMNKKLSASNGCYWNDYLEDNTINTALSLSEVREFLLNKLNRNCSVCQRGAVMVSTIRLGHRFDLDKVYDFEIQSGDDCKVRTGFSLKSMQQMEEEYERSTYKHPHTHNTKSKMMNILCNILVNGDFNKDDKTNYLIKE